MRRIIPAITLAALVAVSCGGIGEDGSPGSGPDPDPVDARRIDIYEATIRSLFETEGWYDPVFIDERVCENTGDPAEEPGTACAELTSAEQTALLEALSDLPSVEFTSRAERITQQIFDGKIRGAGLLAVGPIVGDGDRVEVGGSAYCGGLCGHWMTLVVERTGAGWVVTGTTGPVAIS